MIQPWYSGAADERFPASGSGGNSIVLPLIESMPLIDCSVNAAGGTVAPGLRFKPFNRKRLASVDRAQKRCIWKGPLKCFKFRDARLKISPGTLDAEKRQWLYDYILTL